MHTVLAATVVATLTAAASADPQLLPSYYVGEWNDTGSSTVGQAGMVITPSLGTFGLDLTVSFEILSDLAPFARSPITIFGEADFNGGVGFAPQPAGFFGTILGGINNDDTFSFDVIGLNLGGGRSDLSAVITGTLTELDMAASYVVFEPDGTVVTDGGISMNLVPAPAPLATLAVASIAATRRRR